MSYCSIAPGHPFHGPYHEKEYGFPIRNDSRLFERLALEINQAGLSWLTILKKRNAFLAAFDQFDVDRVASYGRRERSRLLRDAGIIRNELKINAVIENARRIVTLRETDGSFARWLDAHHPLTKEEWVKLFKKSFLFTGGEITGEFLISTGYLPGAHDLNCSVYPRVVKKNPPWEAGLHVQCAAILGCLECHTAGDALGFVRSLYNGLRLVQPRAEAKAAAAPETVHRQCGRRTPKKSRS